MKVSVIMPTYNHENTIAQAIESFLAQQCSFETELIIGNDASTDSTLEVAVFYAQRYPDKIKLIDKPVNEGLMRNYKTLMEVAKGEYVAILESDDYWIDPLKLEKQISSLDADAELGISFCRVNFMKDDGSIFASADCTNLVTSLGGQLYDYSLLRSIIYSPSVIFRKSYYDNYCNIQDYIDLGFRTFDYPAWLSIMAHSKAHYLSDLTAVYRIQSSSISNTNSLKKRLAFEKSVNDSRHYVTKLYGAGGVGNVRIALRETLIYLRIIWKYLVG